MRRYIFGFFILLTLPQIATAAVLEWPVDRAEPWADIDSAFGPRLQSGEGNRYDFHRGMDIEGDANEEIYAMADGEVYRLYYEGEDGNPYTGGGTVVILRHNVGEHIDEPLTHKGKEIAQLYTVYFHLNDIEPSLELDQLVSAGDRIGWMGDTGSTSHEHLHFEVRLGTLCSVYNECNSTGFDPHINPLKLLEYPQANTAKLKVRRNGEQLRLRVKVPTNELDFNRITVTTYNRKKPDKGKRLERKVINLNTRAGIDMTSQDTMDTDIYDGVTISPKSQGDSDAYKVTRFYFDNILTPDTKRVQIQLKDIHGNTLKKRTIRKKNI